MSIVQTHNLESNADEQQVQSMMQRRVRAAYFMTQAQAKGSFDFNGSQKKYVLWDGGRDEKGKVHPPVWPHLVNHIIQVGAEPKAYMWAAFRNSGSPFGPLPKHVTSNGATDFYNRTNQDRVDRLRTQLNLQLRALHGEVRSLVEILHWDLPTAQDSALGSNLDNAIFVLRYCLAEEWKNERLMKLFLPDAICEYAFEKRSFDAAWGIMLSDNFRRKAEQLVPQLLNDNTTMESVSP